MLAAPAGWRWPLGRSLLTKATLPASCCPRSRSPQCAPPHHPRDPLSQGQGLREHHGSPFTVQMGSHPSCLGHTTSSGRAEPRGLHLALLGGRVAQVQLPLSVLGWMLQHRQALSREWRFPPVSPLAPSLTTPAPTRGLATWNVLPFPKLARPSPGSWPLPTLFLLP